MRILQLNLNHCKAAQDLLAQSVRELNIDIAILSEQHANLDEAMWATDYSERTAIWACHRVPFERRMSRKEAGFVWVHVGGVFIYGCYAPPNTTLEEFEAFLDRLVSDARGRSPVIIAGDFNAWAVEWGCCRTNARGQALLCALSALDVDLVNSGSACTFRGAVGSSVVDVTFASSCLVRKGISWTVSEHYTHSDHQAILFTVNSGRNPRPKLATRRTGWKMTSFDEAMFRLIIDDTPRLQGTANMKARDVDNFLTRACDASMSRRVVRDARPPVYWWNEEIAKLRYECLGARRAYQRSRGRDTFLTLQREYKAARGRLKIAIRTSKRQCFEELCREVDRDPWGKPYKTVIGKLKGLRSQSPKCPDLMLKIVTTLFPRQMESTPVIGRTREKADILPVTKEELLKACSKIGNNKAPGPDNIPNVAFKAAIRARPDLFVDIYNACLEEGTFPKRWKVQHLVLLPKGQKPPEEPSSYRPICMLDTAGKTLERIICNRLEEAVDKGGGLALHQYGFRRAHSAIDAIKIVVDAARFAIEGKRWKRGAKKYCAVVTLDVKNAFNSAKWSCIHSALAKFRVPEYIQMIIRDYLSDRLLKYDTENGTKNYQISGGVPQGSVLGPLLWNIMYDAVLRLQLPEEAKIIGFADDIAVVVTAKFTEEVTRICNEAIDIVRQWLATVGLELAEHKTEAVLITSRKLKETITIRVGDQEITSQPSIRYLGVIIDDRLSFKQHIEYTSVKAAKINATISRLMPNLRGPGQNRRKLLASVVGSVMLYGAPIWAEAAQTKFSARRLESVYRLSAIRVTSAFRTISLDAVCVIAGMCPLTLLAKERSRRYLLKDEPKELLRADSIRNWQVQWDQSRKGRWTHRLIPNIEPWVERQHGEIDFHLTQLLSGHGCFRAYLYRFGHDSAPECPSCDGEVEDAEHVFFRCTRFVEQRSALKEILGATPDPDNIVTNMLEAMEKWTAVKKFAAGVMIELRRLERERNSPANT